tara:strand:+ start:2439 stop:2702 length:264 start_codon:yes stop_codon:yes gene_type:complete
MKPEFFFQVVKDIVKERGDNYGSAAENMQNIADRWSMTLGRKVTPAQVVLCMIDVKMSRLQYRMSADSVQDIAGYAAVLNQVMYDGS